MLVIVIKPLAIQKPISAKHLGAKVSLGLFLEPTLEVRRFPIRWQWDLEVAFAKPVDAEVTHQSFHALPLSG